MRPTRSPVACAGHSHVVVAAESPGARVPSTKSRAERYATTTFGRNCTVSGCKSGDSRTAHRSHTPATESCPSSISVWASSCTPTGQAPRGGPAVGLSALMRSWSRRAASNSLNARATIASRGSCALSEPAPSMPSSKKSL